MEKAARWRKASRIYRQKHHDAKREQLVCALFYELDGEAVAVSLINPHMGMLLARNVRPEHRGHGLGDAILEYLVLILGRVVESKIECYEKRGYRRIGKLKCGIRLKTQVMARSALFSLAGNLRKAWAHDLPLNDKGQG